MGKREEIGFFSREVCIFSPRGTSQEVRKTFFPRAKWNFARGKKVFLTKCEVPRGEKIHTSREKKDNSSRAKWNFAREELQCSLPNAHRGIVFLYNFYLCKRLVTTRSYIQSLNYLCDIWKVFLTATILFTEVENTFHRGRKYFSQR